VHKDHLVVKVLQVLKVHKPSDLQVLKGLKEMLVTKVLIVVVFLQDLKVLKGRQELKVLKDKVEDQVHKVLKGTRATQDLQVEQVLLDPHPTQE
jgi:hypothetical protein